MVFVYFQVFLLNINYYLLIRLNVMITPPFWQQCSGAYAVLLTIVALILLYSLYLFTVYGMEAAVNYDVMNHKVIDLPWLENCCSWWPLSHLILFFFLGFCFPHCDFLVLTAGILWELVEVIISKLFHRPRQALRGATGDQGVEYSTNWWAGSFKDILFNFIGFYLGKAMRELWDTQFNPRKRNYFQVKWNRRPCVSRKPRMC
jgi:hypothetical protein